MGFLTSAIPKQTTNSLEVEVFSHLYCKSVVWHKLWWLPAASHCQDWILGEGREKGSEGKRKGRGGEKDSPREAQWDLQRLCKAGPNKRAGTATWSVGSKTLREHY